MVFTVIVSFKIIKAITIPSTKLNLSIGITFDTSPICKAL